MKTFATETVNEILKPLVQSAGAGEYTDCIFAEE